ncbi:hypothetical protein SK128_012461 [Halocaridina rubra]|uniref:Uncharacterized protein n=1 Tax=Halocaridina rubra TaxID=373956 RepID=A0AAN9A070_HALRR
MGGHPGYCLGNWTCFKSTISVIRSTTECQCPRQSPLYSSNLTAVLAIPVYEKPIDSLEDLPRAVEDGYYLATGKGTSMEALFRED